MNTQTLQDFGIWRKAAVHGCLITSKCMHIIFDTQWSSEMFMKAVDTNYGFYIQSRLKDIFPENIRPI